MRQAQIEFLRNALRGDDFSDEVIAGLLQALSELENLMKPGMDRPENSHDTLNEDHHLSKLFEVVKAFVLASSGDSEGWTFSRSYKELAQKAAEYESSNG